MQQGVVDLQNSLESLEEMAAGLLKAIANSPLEQEQAKRKASYEN
jgi:hypothetical protein